MNETFLWSLAGTGFVIAFSHAAIPTHWLPFVMAGRGQRWSHRKTLSVAALCGAGHVLFTTALGVLVVWLGIETSKWTGHVFPWIAGGALILFGLYYLVRQVRGDGHGHSHFGSGGGHDHHDHGDHAQHDHGHSHDTHDHAHGAHRQEGRSVKAAKSDRAVILGLLTLLTFSPCEGFLPVYLSGISYGWTGFVILSAILAVATIAGMVVFTGLTLSGIERLPLGFLENYESGILGTLIFLLGVGIIFLGF
jgi:nickel/cobalt exporter